MKIVLAFLLIALAAVCVSATSAPNCEGVTCDPETCPKHECQCGSHKDACGCCDFCNKCLEEECHPEHNDRCAEGLHCVIGEDATAGHCKPGGASTATPEVNVPDSEAPVDEHHAHHEGGEHAKTGEEAHHE
ncbi:hypothetical protein MRX96_010752 [Rhipicephalus microplus]|uniref:Putative metastriate insulin growth factor binding protein n=1 Tax=Rhipicephalus microplus TaxID=6941 RepID=A0A6G5A6N3_RHIMP|nr:serine protease HTRA1-like [Rhipicephalus microplus]